MLDPDVPKKMLQLLLGTEQDSEEMDLEKVLCQLFPWKGQKVMSIL